MYCEQETINEKLQECTVSIIHANNRERQKEQKSKNTKITMCRTRDAEPESKLESDGVDCFGQSR